MNLKWIFETAYGIIKGYIVAEVAKTGNQQFIDSINKLLTTSEDTWKQIWVIWAQIKDLKKTINK
jgi:hypothetical protein